MKLKIFSIYDSKAEYYLQPFFMQTKRDAIDAFKALVNDDKSRISKHPADFTLFEVGEYDDLTGKFTSYASNISIHNALELKEVSSQMNLEFKQPREVVEKSISEAKKAAGMN